MQNSYGNQAKILYNIQQKRNWRDSTKVEGVKYFHCTPLTPIQIPFTTRKTPEYRARNSSSTQPDVDQTPKIKTLKTITEKIKNCVKVIM